ncbi:Fc.00g014330.m01.CDS01 [Cosmosporella sp. VM-42]
MAWSGWVESAWMLGQGCLSTRSPTGYAQGRYCEHVSQRLALNGSCVGVMASEWGRLHGAADAALANGDLGEAKERMQGAQAAWVGRRTLVPRARVRWLVRARLLERMAFKMLNQWTLALLLRDWRGVSLPRTAATIAQWLEVEELELKLNQPQHSRLNLRRGGFKLEAKSDPVASH